jgi:hypothetical protein
MQFIYLRSLYLKEFYIPRQTFKNVLENLDNLYELVLVKIGVSLESNTPTTTELRFPKYLTKFSMQYCYQFNCNYKDPVYTTLSGASLKDEDCYNLEISDTNIHRVKYLSWINSYERGISTLNELLTNNHELEEIEVLLDRVNHSSFSLISNNINLNRLALFSIEYVELKSFYFPKLPYIKRIELKDAYASSLGTVNHLLRNCPNLQELKLGSYTNDNLILLKIIRNLKSLKKLSITNMHWDSLLLVPFPESTIEHLELTTQGPFRAGLSVFNNLKHLKSVSISGLPSCYMDYYYTIQLFDGYSYWREIRYSNSIQFWKII